MFRQITRDYRSVLGGGESPQGETLPRKAGQARKETRRTIESVKKTMRRVAGLDIGTESGDAIEDQEEGEDGGTQD